MTEEAPDVIGPVTAYRAWAVDMKARRVSAPRLRSLLKHTTWTPGEDLQAICGISIAGRNPHTAPNAVCRCGIYVMDDLQTLLGETSQIQPFIENAPYMGAQIVLGRVEVWGKAIRYSHGRRVEKARVTGLFSPMLLGHAEVQPLCDLYGVEFLTDEALDVTVRSIKARIRGMELAMRQEREDVPSHPYTLSRTRQAQAVHDYRQRYGLYQHAPTIAHWRA